MRTQPGSPSRLGSNPQPYLPSHVRFVHYASYGGVLPYRSFLRREASNPAHTTLRSRPSSSTLYPSPGRLSRRRPTPTDVWCIVCVGALYGHLQSPSWIRYPSRPPSPLVHLNGSQHLFSGPSISQTLSLPPCSSSNPVLASFSTSRTNCALVRALFHSAHMALLGFSVIFCVTRVEEQMSPCDSVLMCSCHWL
ncbi:hypothetical protein M427DRAFT_248389 [Gonapodya prolifera JEL478]|uniref:Uncharacterized protein n=1 Tax=Gonapodya prolifera (strain JEL478) TaxID=1344416 RepID=A0A138ZXL4_GONPJ|nr:hypothetical protein M427DRAFT_248389 [Gonapodya prolifera JEL478]|eukprot:KXS09219.1 hypothetical protein M427DRAFT_248389 [Gonapodya prolifera JEL478]